MRLTVHSQTQALSLFFTAVVCFIRVTLFSKKSGNSLSVAGLAKPSKLSFEANSLEIPDL